MGSITGWLVIRIGIKMQEIYDKIMELLQELHEDIDYEKEEELIDSKVLDSFDLITLVAELSEEFDIEITAEEFIPKNFNSAKALAEMVYRLQDE